MAKRKPAAKKVAKNPAGKRSAKKVGMRVAIGGEAKPPAIIAVPKGEIDAERRRVEAIVNDEPVFSWTRWCPQTFPDGKGMGATGAPVSSLAAINPSPADCAIVASEMQEAQGRQRAADGELSEWSTVGEQFFKTTKKRFASALQVALEGAVMTAVNPDFVSGGMTEAEAKKLYDTIVAAGAAGFEFALRRYARALRDVPELKDAIAKATAARRAGAEKSIKQQQDRRLERAAQARELYASGTMTYAAIAERLGVSVKTVSRYLNG